MKTFIVMLCVFATAYSSDQLTFSASQVYPNYNLPEYLMLTGSDLANIQNQIGYYRRWEKCYLTPGSMDGCKGPIDEIIKKIILKVATDRQTVPFEQQAVIETKKAKYINKEKLLIGRIGQSY